jgi:hypothetical protein
MFQEAIAKQTAEYLRGHLEEYLQTVASRFTGTDRLTLKVPDIKSSTLVGGAMQADIKDLPAIGVDCLDKQEIPSGESLCYYQYDGAIAGLISASSAGDVDRLAKRHASAIELFVREHQFLHQFSTPDFSMREFIYVNTTFSGAIQLELEEEKPIWVDGFTHNVLWITSEDQYRQHL